MLHTTRKMPFTSAAKKGRVAIQWYHIARAFKNTMLKGSGEKKGLLDSPRQSLRVINNIKRLSFYKVK